MKKKLIVLSSFVFGLVPMVALAAQQFNTGANLVTCEQIFAQNGGNIVTIQGILCKLAEVFNAVLPVLLALGVVFFVWGVLMYVLFDDEEAKKRGRDRMIWGIIGLAVIIGLWGLVNLLNRTFNLQNNGQVITFPTTPN